MIYRDYILTPGPNGAGCPPWLLHPYGAAWLRAIGDTLDVDVQRTREAVVDNYPNLCPEDALPVVGDEYGMYQGVMEPAAQFRLRLVAAWDLWQHAGTAYGILLALWWAGYENVTLDTQTGKRYWLLTPPTGDPVVDLQRADLPLPVHLGGSPELWNQFIVRVFRPFPSWWWIGAVGGGAGSTTLQVDATAGDGFVILASSPGTPSGIKLGDKISIGTEHTTVTSVLSVGPPPHEKLEISPVLVANHLAGTAVHDGPPVDGSQDQQDFARLLLAWKSAMSQCVNIKVIDGLVVGYGLIVGSFTVGDGTSTDWTSPVG